MIKKAEYLVLYAVLGVLAFAIGGLIAIQKSPQKPEITIEQEAVVVNETWIEETYYNGKWFIVSLIIGETNQRQFQFRSIDSADSWLKSLLASPKYDVMVRDWFYMHGKE
jgi:hypothetical protein